MSTLSGPFTTDDRDLLSLTANSVALLPVTGAAALASHLSCVAQTRIPRPDAVTEAITLGQQVRQALLAETDPGRWWPEVEGLDDAIDVVGDLITQRRAQAEQVATAVAILQTAGTRLGVTA